MRTLVRSTVVLAAMLALLAPGATSVSAAGISVSPSSGLVGSTTSVSGSGFAASTSVRIFFNGSGGTLVGTQTSDALGNLPAISVVIPGAVGGSYPIFATDGTNTATTNFSVPGLTLSPTSGGPGTSVNASGAGFLSGEVLVLTWDQGGNQLTSTTANGSGAFSTTFSVPSSSGTHTVFAVGQTNHFALSAAFTVSSNVGGANLSVSPTSGTAGTTVGLTGTGFGASEQVNLAVDGGVVASVTSDASGNFGTTVALSQSLALGDHSISAAGMSSGHMAFATFSVTSVAQQPTSCTGDDDTRPGNGFGDKNHCHTGPPGHQNDDEDTGGHGHDHGGHGHGNGKGQDDD